MLRTDDRLLFPLLREDRARDFNRVSWPAALGRFALAIRKAQHEHGPHAVMLYGSGHLVTEDYYLFGKIAKGYLGTDNQDTNSRLCMASAVAAYSLSLGADSPPCSYADIEAAKTFLIVGANPEACHPILFNRIKARQRADKDVRVILIDPRRTGTAEIADIHLGPRPGSDVALLNSLPYEALLMGSVDHDFIARHTTGWDELARVLGDYQAERAYEQTGVAAQDILDAARVCALNRPALSLWAMALNQSTRGADSNLAIINLALATGNIGKPGAGPFSLTEQPNAMGGREAGGLATALPGHRQAANRLAPLLPVVREDRGLSNQQAFNSLIACVYITIVARIAIGWILDRAGPRGIYTAVRVRFSQSAEAEERGRLDAALLEQQGFPAARVPAVGAAGD